MTNNRIKPNAKPTNETQRATTALRRSIMDVTTVNPTAVLARSVFRNVYAMRSERPPGPDAEQERRRGVVLGGIENLQVRRHVEPGGDGRIVKQLHAVLRTEPVNRENRQCADSEMVVTDADRVVIATVDRAGPHQRRIGEPADRVRVPIGQARSSSRSPASSSPPKRRTGADDPAAKCIRRRRDRSPRATSHVSSVEAVEAPIAMENLRRGWSAIDQPRGESRSRRKEITSSVGVPFR
jgi:hypothetical protein